LVADAVLAESEAQAAALWRIRHSVSEGSKRAGYVVSHDSAVPLENQAAFARNVERRILEAAPEARVVMHGHIGDGNIHVLAILDRARYPDADAAGRSPSASTRPWTTRRRRRAASSAPSTASGSATGRAWSGWPTRWTSP
jgi:FAD/FMN-containing dehydrogenase